MDSIAESRTTQKPKWHQNISRTGYFIGAVLLHLVLFLMLAGYVVFKQPASDDDTHFQAIKLPRPPPPPPAPPPPQGGAAANVLEPTIQETPPSAAPTVLVSISPSTFSIKSSKVPLPNLPAAISLPSGTALSGHDSQGEALGAGTAFGSAGGNGTSMLQGFLYDLKQSADRKPTGMNPAAYHEKIKQFVASNWDPHVLENYYKCPNPLNASSIFIPIIHASDGPKAFNVENEVKPNMYAIWYKAKASPTEDGTYHFVGTADDILVVKVNGQTVLDGCIFSVDGTVRHQQQKFAMTGYNPTCQGNADFWIGTPFHVTAGEQVDIDVLIGEEPGGFSNYFLYIARDETTYKKQSNGSPLLPIFQLNTDPIHPTGNPGSYPPFSSDPAPWQPAESQP